MNAIQFIKEHGVEKAREVVSGAPDLAEYYSTIDGEYYRIELHAVNLRHIKRLVDSIYLVKEHYTLDRAKKYADSPYTAPEIKERLEQAIADYEQLFGNTETSELETLRDCDTSPNCKKFDEGVK